ncbi:endonuclease/exonuclease/phosphatase family protein [Cellulomonas sp. PhB143]|uniref:endonuclease/exonuclease/phosphatase family protein n=1 Tax=Cellulomonas sp. PhB143 TaxID=2485186 RepID=UPI000F477C4D|nr:endonuclease/exonuclease/phosphatase family protein [Cellulomonas sp. PhB143]ROS79179.1 endonuclease/exonuclease/phosphatase family metal-dependent hydrolase [Cellulomonas sp. PhB143]
MRLASFNVQHGRPAVVPGPGLPPGPRDHALHLARYRDAVASLGADVVALQEIEQGRRRSGRADHLAHAAEAADAVDHRFVATRRGYGIGIVSRIPVTSWHELHLPALRLPRVRRTRRPPFWRVVRDEPRAALAAVLATDDGPLTVVATHLSVVRPRTTDQLHVLRVWAERLPRPLVLLGDLNLRPPVPEQITGWRSLAAAPTYPGHRPRAQIDHVLADGDVRAAGPARALATGVGDHRALVVDVVVGRRG